MIYINVYTNFFIKLPPFVQKILSENAIFTLIKGHNSIVNEWNELICKPKPPIPDANTHAKFEENPSELLKLEIGYEIHKTPGTPLTIESIEPLNICDKRIFRINGLSIEWFLSKRENW